MAERCNECNKRVGIWDGNYKEYKGKFYCGTCFQNAIEKYKIDMKDEHSNLSDDLHESNTKSSEYNKKNEQRYPALWSIASFYKVLGCASIFLGIVFSAPT